VVFRKGGNIDQNRAGQAPIIAISVDANTGQPEGLRFLLSIGRAADCALETVGFVVDVVGDMILIDHVLARTIKKSAAYEENEREGADSGFGTPARHAGENERHNRGQHPKWRR